MSVQKKELIARLEEIASLYQNTVAIQTKMEAFTPEDHYERKVAVPPFPGDFPSEKERQVWADRLDHTGAEAPEVAELAHRRFYGPKEPEKPKDQAFEKLEGGELHEKQVKFGRLSKVSAGVAIFFLLGTLLNLNDEYSVLPTLIIITLIAAAGFLFFRYKAKAAKAEEEKENAEALRDHERRKQVIMAEYAEKMKVYERECEQYELVLQDFMKDYLTWREIYIQSVNEEAQIEEQLEADRKAGVAKLHEEQYVPAEAALKDANDLVPETYLPVLRVIIDLLKSNRADDLKDAINLYEEILYREKQLQLQREQEEQRQREEEQRRQDEERRYREEMKFREEQERQRRRDEEQRRSDEERRHREDMRAREAEARSRELQEKERLRKEQYKQHMSQIEQQNKQRSAGQAQCRACVHAARCNMSIHNNAPTCTGFTPRR